MTQLQLSIEEFSFGGYHSRYQSDEHYVQIGVALMDVLRQCTHLRKVSLIDDVLVYINLEELLAMDKQFRVCSSTVEI